MADAQYGIALVGQDLTGPAWQSFINNTRAANKAVQDLRGPMDQMVGLAKQARAAFALVIGNEVVQKAIEFHKQIQEQVGALKDQADGLNLSTDSLQAYIAAFAKSGYAEDAARGSLTKFNQLIGEASLGNQGAIDTFNRLGVKILDNNGKVRDHNDILREAAAKLLAMNEGSQRVALSMQSFGRSGGQLTPVLRDLVLGIDELTRRAKASGTVVSGETIEAFEKLNRSSDTLRLQIRTLYAQIAAPIETRAIDYVTGRIERLGAAYGRANKAALEFTAGEVDKQISALDKKIAAADDNLRNPSWIERQLRTPSSAAVIQRDIDDMKTERAKLDAALAKYRATTAPSNGTLDFVMNDGLPAKSGGASNPLPTGGGAGEHRDRIGEALNQLRAQADASTAAYKRLQDATNNSIPLKDLEREVALQKDIADELARIGKYKADDPRIPAIKELIKVREEADSKAKAFDETLKLADSTSRQYGDGQRALAEEQKKLADAFATGRLPLDAYQIALQQLAQATEDLRLKNIGLKGGFEGFLAGLQNAQNQFTRANNAFAMGGKLYDHVMADMSSASDALFNNTEVNFQKIVAGWAKMLLDMEMRAAASNIWGLLTGGATNAGIFGGLFGSAAGYVPPVTATTNTIPDIGTLVGSLPAFADGGDYPAGKPRIVGENGWEIDIPRTAGTVLNQKQLADLLAGVAPGFAASSPRTAAPSKPILPSFVGGLAADRGGRDDGGAVAFIAAWRASQAQFTRSLEAWSAARPGEGTLLVPPLMPALPPVPDLGLPMGRLPGFADGGDYPAGKPRIVGENGWEIDIPRTAGTVLNQKQLADLLAGVSVGGGRPALPTSTPSGPRSMSGAAPGLVGGDTPKRGDGGFESYIAGWRALQARFTRDLAAWNVPQLAVAPQLPAPALPRLPDLFGHEFAPSLAPAAAPGFAEGGTTPTDRPFWVGEDGPELMQFDRPGRVVNQKQLAEMGNGGDSSVAIHQTFYFGSDVNQATLRTWGEKIKADTFAAVVADRRRGGVTKKVFG